MARVMVVADNTLDWDRTRELRALCQSYAAYLGEPVEFVWTRPELAGLARESVDPMPGDSPVEVLLPFRVQTEGMPAVALAVDEDGAPDRGPIVRRNGRIGRRRRALRRIDRRTAGGNRP